MDSEFNVERIKFDRQSDLIELAKYLNRTIQYQFPDLNF